MKTKRQYIVTVKQYQDGHEPNNKRIGNCITSVVCTDFTGHHHSVLIQADTISEAQNKIVALFGEIHITRVEETITYE